MKSALCFVVPLLGVGACAIALQLADRPWMDSSLPVDERVGLLLNAMTDDEKIAQVQHVWTTVQSDQIIKEFGLTSVGAAYTFSITNDTCMHDPLCRLTAHNELQVRA